MCHLKALNYPTHLMYMLNFMCNYENQYICIRTFLSTNVDIIIIFYNIFDCFLLCLHPFQSLFTHVETTQGFVNAEKKSAKINLSKNWLLILPFEVFGAGYL